MKTKLPNEGEIIHPKKLPKEIMKCIGPLESYNLKDGKPIQTESFVLTNDYPKPHYLVVDRIVKAEFVKNTNWCLVYMITHSKGFNNMKIAKHLYHSSDINLENSYITRDKFLINIESINPKRIFGKFDLEILVKELNEY